MEQYKQDSGMKKYKQDFIQFLLDRGAIKLGEFKLKDGRTSPWFVDLRAISDGKGLRRLAQAYAEFIKQEVSVDEFDVLFGPAYAAIPLASATAMVLAEKGANKPVAYDRKEAKGYGRAKGLLLGAEIRDNSSVLILDDVFTTGKTKYNAIDLLNQSAENIQYAGVVVAVDRQDNDASEEFSKKTGIPIYSILTASEIFAYMQTNNLLTPEQTESLKSYFKQHGNEELQTLAKLL